jgi:hypothetical protein
LLPGQPLATRAVTFGPEAVVEAGLFVALPGSFSFGSSRTMTPVRRITDTPFALESMVAG